VFNLRINAPELLDSPDMEQSFAIRSYHFMSIVNRYFGGTAIVKSFIKNAAKTRDNAEPLKILDIGSGACDIPAAICRWANAAQINLEITCIETNPYAIKLAQENIKDYPNIKLVQEDIFSYQPDEKYDCATGSLFFHHLADEQILDLINTLRTFGCRSILINDLHRSLLCYAGCLIASLFIRSDVRHDALLSIRKGFKPAQLYELTKKVPQSSTSVQKVWFGRVYAILHFTEDGR
jgi:2-polyprenyl-3-methyl-5-hydroxy-6-metoxy-1,4-benzoquinol methylase